MTKQETFDTVVAHLRKQGQRAVELRGSCESGGPTLWSCLYRTRGGLKCAAGCLIPDDMYDPRYEGSGVSRTSDGATMVAALIASLGHDLLLVNNLQLVHDAHEVSGWEQALNQVADTHDLVYTPPQVAA